MGIDELLSELVGNTLTAQRLGPRMRLAVSPSEYEKLRQYILDRDGRFYSRIRALPLVVEDDPTHPPLLVEFTSTDVSPGVD